MNPRHANLLVFDSGVGGLSIVKHLRSKIPAASIQYLADNAYLPYGALAEHRLIDRADELITSICKKQAIDLVVVACNSASTLVLPRLRKRLDIPVVGVVPAIKPAALKSKNKVIGLLATEGTIHRDYTDELIKNFAQDCKVIRVGSSKLVTMIEQMMRGVEHPLSEFADILKPLRDHQGWESLDTVVLACTHFPLAKKQLSKAAPEINYWIDSGAAISRRVMDLLQQSTANKNPSSPIPNGALLTDLSDSNDFLINNFKQFGFQSVQLLEI